MADFRFKVGADYSEFLASSRGVISGLRGELKSLQAQALLHVGTEGNVAGIGGALQSFQGRGQAVLDEALKRGAISQTQYNTELAGLQRSIAELRIRINREAQGAGLDPRSRVPPINPEKVAAAQTGQTAVFEGQRVRATREAAAAAERDAEQIRADVVAEAALRAEARAALQARIRAELVASGETVTQARQRRFQEVTGQEAPDVAARRRADEEAAAVRAASQSRREVFEDRTGSPAGADRRLLQEKAQQAARETANNALIAEKSTKLKESLDAQQAEIVAQRQNVQLIAQVNNERRKMVAELRRAEIGQANPGVEPGGSVWQRLQAFVANRRGGGGGGVSSERLPEEFQSFGQFFTSKAITTGGFALSGALLYGTVQAFRDTIREASALQRELSIVKAQFDDVGKASDGLAQGVGFKDFAKQVVEVSIDTGIAADEVTRVSRQLAGVFKTDTGLPDFNRALDQTHEALKLSQVTGLPYQEITDSLTAITSTFGTSFTTIGDLAVGLEQKFGVLAPEIIKFTADLAPVAKELGFTVDQIASLGAIAQQRSGVSGGALAESFNRALPTIQGNQVGLIELLGQRDATSSFIKPTLDALSQGQGAQVIAQLTSAYGEMTKGQRNALAELLGGQRNAKAFFAVLQGGKDTIDALNNSEANLSGFGGKLDQRFKDFQSTVEFSFQRARRAMEEFGLAIFNSGIADGLKLIADNGAVVAQFVSELVTLFTTLNDAMGGIPVKLLAIYTTLRLISALRNNVKLGGITSALRGGVAAATGEEAVEGGAPGIILPPGVTATVAQDAARRAPLLTSRLANFAKSKIGQEVGQGVVASGVKAQLAGVAESLAPIIAITAVTSLVSTIGNVNASIKAAQGDLATKVRDALAKGTSPDEILRRAQASGGFDDATGSTAGDVALKVFSFGTADTTSPGDKALDEIQKANAERQGKELDAIFKGADEAQRKAFAQLIARAHPGDPLLDPNDERIKKLAKTGGLEQFLKDFLNDPANNANNDAVAQIINLARSGGASPEVVKSLEDLAASYGKLTQQNQTSSAAQDFLVTLDDVKAQYDAGNASLAQLLDAENHEIELLRTHLDDVTDPTEKAKVAKQLATELKNRDQVITQAAQRVAETSIKFAGVGGGNVVQATASARLQQALTAINQGATPDTQVDLLLNALDAQTAVLNQAVNAPVVVDGIARAPTTAEKLARLAAGIKIPPELRQALVKANLSTGSNKVALTALATAEGKTVDELIDGVSQAIADGKTTVTAVLGAQIDAQIQNMEHLIASLNSTSDRSGAEYAKKLESSLAALKSLRANLPQVDPGPTISGDQTDLEQQQKIEASQEARAYEEALVAQQRARAHGDPIGVAQAGVRSAQIALRYARASGKPSEVAAAQAQLIDAQNQLEDANNAIGQARFNVSIAVAAGDPVKQAQLRLQQLRQAAANVHGEAERLQNLAAQIDADRALHDAMEAIVLAQIDLARAVAEAGGDTVKAAQLGLQQAQEKLNDLLKQGADPNGEAILRAKAAVVQANAAVRDSKLSTQQRDIDFALQMEQITTQQAIAQLQALLQLPGITVEQTQQLLLKIKQLQNDVSRDLQFDIPSEIKLPTMYEVRRLQQVGTPGGPQTYQDQRSYQINLSAGNQVDLQPAVDIIVGAITAPPRNGSVPGAYSN